MTDSPYVADPGNPTGAELAAAIQRGLADGSLITADQFLARAREVDEGGSRDVVELAALILEQRRERLARDHSDWQADDERVEVIAGPKYTKINRGPAHNMSGFLMIENTTGTIYGIKGYGTVHKGHCYGTVAAFRDWYWGEYSPRKVT